MSGVSWSHEDLAEYLERFGSDKQDIVPLDDLSDLDDYLQTYSRKAKAAASQQLGSEGEDVAETALKAYGVEMVEQIATPYIISDRREDGWVRIKRKAKVSGDRRGVMADGSGRRVLAEVKSTNGDRIVWSRLEDHQVRALDKNNRLKAVSLLVLVFSQQAYVLRWPVEGFGPRKSITQEQAIGLQWDGKE